MRLVDWCNGGHQQSGESSTRLVKAVSPPRPCNSDRIAIVTVGQYIVTKTPEEKILRWWFSFAIPEKGISANRLLCSGAQWPELVEQPFKDRNCGWTYLVPVCPEN